MSKRNIPASVVNKMNDVLQMMNLPIQEDENFYETPRRFLNYLAHYTQPYDPAQDLETTFPLSRDAAKVTDRAMVVQCRIPYRAVCAHHLLPVTGQAHLGYIPRDRAVGLSKLTRIVSGISHRLPSLQEDVCDQITEALMEHLKPVGAICVIDAGHGCMGSRGVEEHGIQTVTSSVKGVFITHHEARQEFYKLVEVGANS